MAYKRFLTASLIALGFAIFTGRTASAQTGGAYALGYATYAMQHAQVAYQAVPGHLSERAYYYSYYAYYYAYYGFYVDRSYFGFTYGLAAGAHDYGVDAYDATGNVDMFYAQYYSNLVVTYAMDGYFNR